MPQKIHRRSTVFRRRNWAPLKISLTVLACAGLVVAGYFATKTIMENPPAKPGASNNTAVTTTAVTTPATSAATAPATQAPAGALRAFYLPRSQGQNTSALDSTLAAAKAAGFNAVLLDLKGADGKLHYVSATPLAVQAAVTADDALSLPELTSLAAHLREQGFTGIPRLYAFRDAAAPSKLPSAKVTLESNPGYTWYDNDPAAGGKAWLNPYAADAHRYLTELAVELQTAGFRALMLDGVQFPDQAARAYYGNGELTKLSKSEVLTKFVTDLRAAVTDTQVLLTAPGLAMFGEATGPYGGNPLTFGAQRMAAVLFPSTLGNRLTVGEETVDNPAAHPYEAVKLAISQLQRRLGLMDATKRPMLTPWLQGDGYTAAQMIEQIRALKETLGDDASYVLYNADGSYPFSAL